MKSLDPRQHDIEQDSRRFLVSLGIAQRARGGIVQVGKGGLTIRLMVGLIAFRFQVEDEGVGQMQLVLHDKD